MKSVFICGSGRSGTSMLAGLFSDCGYFQGEELYSPRDANPKGFFENWEINSLNERIIRFSLRAKYDQGAVALFESLYREGHYWLARFPDDMQCVASVDDKAGIAALVDREPFCYKDPRFSYTLSAWLQASPEAIAICVFRHPGTAVASILKELQSVDHLQRLNVRVLDLYEMWENTYLRLLELRARGFEVYFVNYSDLFSESKQAELEELVGSRLNRSFPEVQLARTEYSGELEARTASIFDLLKLLASRRFSEQSPEVCKVLASGLSLTGHKSGATAETELERNKTIWPANVSELAEARMRLAEEQQRAVNLEEVNGTLGGELAEARMRLAEEQQRAVNLEEVNGTLGGELAEARMRLAEEQQRIEAYEQSSSWRITRPMRTFKKWVVRLKP